MNTLIIPTLFSGFFFTFASRCVPTFFTFFLSNKGYTNKGIILISSIYFLGAILTANIIFNVRKSVKMFHVSATIGTIILLLQYKVHKVYGWFLIRFCQGILESICRNSLHNIFIDKYRHLLVFIMNLGFTCGLLLLCYQEDFLLLFTITGILLSLSHLCLAFQSQFHCNNSLVKLKSATLKDLWIDNKYLFLIVILTYLLNGTFNTILPIMLKENSFTNKEVLRIMFIGSLGNTILQLITHYIKNLFGEITSVKKMTNVILIMYIACFVSIQYFKYLTSLFIFIIMGIHSSLNFILTNLFKNILSKDRKDLHLDSTFQILNSLGSIAAAILSLIFIDNFSRYGLFVNWFGVILLIKYLLKSFLKNYIVE
jgi:hypothetical protein